MKCNLFDTFDLWPGASLGVRAPWPGETPLSWAEVHHAVREGLL